MPLLSQLSANGNYTIAGTFDEATFNRNSGYKKNLFPYSQLFSNPNGWDTTGLLSTVSLGIAPDGTNTATLITEDTSVNNSHWYTNHSSVPITPYGRYTFSCYFRPVSGDRNFFIQLYDGAGYAQIQSNTTGGILSAASTSGYYSNASGTIVAVGNGWFRASVTATLGPLSIVNIRIAMFNNGAQYYSGNGKSCMYIWGAQIESGTSVTIYEVTDASGLSSSNTASRLDTSGNFYTGGIIDEATYNPTSTYTKNLLANSNWIGGTSGTNTVYVVPTGYIGFGSNATGSILYAPALSGIGNSCRFYGNSVRPYFSQYNTFSIAPKSIYTYTVKLEDVTVSCTYSDSFIVVGSPGPTSYSFYLNGSPVGTYDLIPVGSTGIIQCVIGWPTSTSTIPINNNIFRIGFGTSGVTTGDITLANPQIEFGNTISSYSTTRSSYQPTTTTGTLAAVNFASKLDTSGNLYLSGTYDEASRNPNSGYIKNLFSYSTDLTNATYWTTNKHVVSSTTELAPDGSNTAVKFYYKLPGSVIQTQTNTITRSVYRQVYTASVYAKMDTIPLSRNWNLAIVATGSIGSYANFNMYSGTTIAGGGPNNISVAVTPAPNGFYRISLTFASNVSSGSESIGFWLGGYNADTFYGQSMTLWGPQLEIGYQATDYVPTGLNGIPLN